MVQSVSSALALPSRALAELDAKVCGAGGGGCVFFLVEPDAKAKVVAAIEAAGAQVLEAHLAPKGVTVKNL